MVRDVNENITLLEWWLFGVEPQVGKYTVWGCHERESHFLWRWMIGVNPPVGNLTI